MPPVTNTLMPAHAAHIMVVATVVLPLPLLAIIDDRSLLEHFRNVALFLAISSIYALLKPILMILVYLH